MGQSNSYELKVLTEKEGYQTHRAKRGKTGFLLEWEKTVYWPGDHACGLEFSRWEILETRTNVLSNDHSSPRPCWRVCHLSLPSQIVPLKPIDDCILWFCLIAFLCGITQVSALDCPQSSYQRLLHLGSWELRDPSIPATLSPWQKQHHQSTGMF